MKKNQVDSPFKSGIPLNSTFFLLANIEFLSVVNELCFLSSVASAIVDGLITFLGGTDGAVVFDVKNR